MIQTTFICIMRKAQPTAYVDEPYINIELLPQKQLKKIDSWLGEEDLEVVEFNGNFRGNFLSYSEYEYWYENIYSTKSDIDRYDQF